jgi:hypothetical protein
MTDIILAFYKGKGNWIDWCIRKATRSEFSHVELFYGGIMDREATCYSSSARDGGVRKKHIALNPEHWHIVKVQFTNQIDLRVVVDANHAKYDYLGILFSQFFSFRGHDKNKWFCSELCAAMLKLRAPETYSPARLFDTVCQLNHAWDEGRRNASS